MPERIHCRVALNDSRPAEEEGLTSCAEIKIDRFAGVYRQPLYSSLVNERRSPTGPSSSSSRRPRRLFVFLSRYVRESLQPSVIASSVQTLFFSERGILPRKNWPQSCQVFAPFPEEKVRSRKEKRHTEMHCVQKTKRKKREEGSTPASRDSACRRRQKAPSLERKEREFKKENFRLFFCPLTQQEDKYTR